MKVLSIGTDRKLFEANSQVFDRSLLYAEKTEEMHIIVFTLRKEGHKPYKTANLNIYPTNSTSQWFYVADAYKLGKKIIKENNMISKGTVVSTQDPFQTGFVGVILSRKFSLPLQVQIHTDYLSPHFSNSFFNLIRRMIASYVIPRASALRVVSNTIKESLVKNFSKIGSIDVLPVFVDIMKIVNTVPTRDLNKDFPQFDIIILMASRLSEEKRIDLALRAFVKVIKEHPKVGLVIAGQGEKMKILKSKVHELGLEKSVVFLGWQEDLTSLFKTADIFLLTSEFEGYGMTLIEAGAAGIPIVTTRVGIAKSEIFMNGKNCLICEVGDVNCISNSLSSLISRPENRELFKQRMQDSIKTTAVSKAEYTEMYVNLLRKLI